MYTQKHRRVDSAGLAAAAADGQKEQKKEKVDSFGATDVKDHGWPRNVGI